MPHIASWKKEEVKDLKGLIGSHKVVGMADLSDIPAPQLQKMRRTLKDSAQIKMSRKTLMNLALNDSEKTNIKALSEHMEGQPALIFTDMNPFKLYKILEESKTQAPAKAGNIAPSDIVVPQGDTAFPPGPMLGELQKIGIPAKIDKGKIVITKDKTVVEEGEQIPGNVASILTRLEIHPMEVGIDLKAAYEDQTIYTADLLTIDSEKTLSDIQNAYTKALNLSVNAEIFNKVSMPILISKAATNAINLAVNSEILNGKTILLLIPKAYNQMLALASEIAAKNSDAVDDDIRGKLSSSTVTVEEPEEEDDESPDEEEESEEEKEEEAAAGLGSLFG
ncbi:MAG: 50S ribosomal protein L10 [Methanobacterium sp.]|nr:50S ribosomal protein L10 [Methanobacterium sp.]